MRRTPLERRTPLTPTATLSRSGGLTRSSPPRRTTLARRPRRQPAHSPWPMTCPPGFHAAMLRRAANRCERCDAHTRLTLSHRLPASKGGPFTAWNIDVLCMGPDGADGGCHTWVEHDPEAAEAEGWRVAGSIVRGRYVGSDYRFRATVERALREATS